MLSQLLGLELEFCISHLETGLPPGLVSPRERKFQLK